MALTSACRTVAVCGPQANCFTSNNVQQSQNRRQKHIVCQCDYNYDLFNNAVSSSYGIPPNGGLNSKEWIGKDMNGNGRILVWGTILARSVGGTEKTTKRQSDYPLPRAKCEPGTSRMLTTDSDVRSGCVSLNTGLRIRLSVADTEPIVTIFLSGKT
jgi:hypothetical protein